MNFTMAVWAGFGGFLGSTGRYLLSAVIPFTVQSFAWATFIVNMAGCLLIGFLFNTLENSTLKVFLISGILGGFTTFSGFGLELFKYFEAGNKLLGAGYAVFSLIAGVVFVWIGNKIAVLWA